MTYSEFRDQFSTVEQFRWAYGKLTEEEANALITAEVCPTHIKAAMFPPESRQEEKSFLGG